MCYLIQVNKTNTTLRWSGLIWLALATLSACEAPVAETPGKIATSAAPLSTAVRVRTAVVRRADIGTEARASGVVEPFRRAVVAAETSGRIVERLVEPGDAVTQGQALVKLDGERAEIARRQAAARQRTSTINLAEARSELKRGQDLKQRQFISEDTLETLRFAVQRAESALLEAQASLATADRTLADATVRASFDGTAEMVHAQVGDFLNAGSPVVTLVDFSRARVRAGVTAREAAQIQTGAQASIGLDALGSGNLQGTVRSVSRISDPVTGNYTAEIWIDNQLGRLREGMLASVNIHFAAPEQNLVVPSIAVFRRTGTTSVFVAEGDKAHLRAIETGRASGAVIEVVHGLAPGEHVVVDGQFALRDGAPLVVLSD